MARGRKPEPQHVRELKKEFQRVKHNVLRKLKRVLEKYPDLPSTKKRIEMLEEMHVKGLSVEEIQDNITKIEIIGARKISSVKTAREAKSFLNFIAKYDPDLVGRAFQLYEKYVIDGTFNDKYKYNVIEDIIEKLNNGEDIENDPSYWNEVRDKIYEMSNQEYLEEQERMEKELTTKIKY